MLSPDLIDRFRALIGDAHVLTEADAIAPFAQDQRQIQQSHPVAVLKPGTVEEVAAIVTLARENALPLIPQGGNTGLVGGTVAMAGTGAILLNLSRLNRIRDLDAADYTVTVEAGCILAEIQQAASGADRYFPLSLGAEGSCMLGGNLSTNAGGILTLRYGNARDLVLGLEVVLPDGRVWNGLRRLRKDNTGYDLKHLFLGAEGTLGIITAATLKLYPKPRRVETALVGLDDPAAAVALLAQARAGTGDMLSAFELMPRFAIDGARDLLGRDQDPLPTRCPWYVLLEVASGLEGTIVRDMLEGVLGNALEHGLIMDAVLAESEEQRRRLWLIREGLPEIGRAVRGSVHTDVSVPISRIPDFLATVMAKLESYMPGIRPYPFGHVGDGNIHCNVARPVDMATGDFKPHAEAITAIIHEQVLAEGGSISAEHGIGNRKVAEMAQVKDPVELDLMRQVKALLDPTGIMNPGKVLE